MQMSWFLLNLPFMLIGLAIGVGPLLYIHFREARPAQETHNRFKSDVLADLERLSVSPATRSRIERSLSSASAV
ncbi:MAG: hypothetical protein M0Z87_11760 [Actinomycetota bacterium]|nr:hypothetical protein [Actinomycetota bacterium]